MNKTSSYLVVWASSKQELRMGILSGSAYAMLPVTQLPVDTGLLIALDAAKKKLINLAGIGIVTDALGSFASSRLILATLNVVAWSRNVPILKVPAAWESLHVTALAQKVQKHFKGKRVFREQLLPAYQAPADITVSHKKKKFTVR